MRYAQITVKQSLYALEDPATGLYFAVCGAKPELKPRALATLCSDRQALMARAAQLLADQPHELVRFDA